MIVLGVSLSLGFSEVGEARVSLLKSRVARKISSKVRRTRVKLHRYLQPRLRPSPGIMPENATRGVWPALRKATGATDNLRRKVSYKIQDWANHLQREKRTVAEYRQRYKGEEDKVKGIVRIGKYSFKSPNAPQPLDRRAYTNTLDDAARALWKQAKDTKRPAAYLFNNIALIAKPGDRSPETALRRYYRREGRVYGSSRKAAYWLGKLGRSLAPPMY
jgi:hypothetical protein